MSHKTKITFLGTGSALGVPQLGCSCAVCDSKDQKNHRLRSCFLIETGSKSFLLDPGPDIKFQMLQHPIKKLDGVIVTHCHHDHIGGFDDLRIYAIKQKHVIPTLIHQSNVDELKQRCGYLFKPGFTFFSLDVLHDNMGQANFQGFPFRFVTYKQNGMTVVGYIHKNVAFVSDIQNVTDELARGLQDLDVLIVSCVLTPSAPYKSHLSLDEIYDLKARTGAKNVIITHMGHDIDYKKVSNDLLSDVQLSYDGFVLEV